MRYPVLRALRHSAAATLMAAAAAALAGQSTPQKPQDPDPQRPTFRTEANFVRVDVYPTAGGKPLTDLRKEGFELLEDGRPQAVETFEYVRIAQAGPRLQRADPDSIDAMRQAAANPRSRICRWRGMSTQPPAACSTDRGRS